MRVKIKPKPNGMSGEQIKEHTVEPIQAEAC